MSQKGGTYHHPSSGWGVAPQPGNQIVKDEQPVVDEKTGHVVDEKTAPGTNISLRNTITQPLSEVDKEDEKEWIVVNDPTGETETPSPCGSGMSSQFNLQLGRAKFSWAASIRREHDHGDKEE